MRQLHSREAPLTPTLMSCLVNARLVCTDAKTDLCSNLYFQELLQRKWYKRKCALSLPFCSVGALFIWHQAEQGKGAGIPHKFWGVPLASFLDSMLKPCPVALRCSLASPGRYSSFL